MKLWVSVEYKYNTAREMTSARVESAHANRPKVLLGGEVSFSVSLHCGGRGRMDFMGLSSFQQKRSIDSFAQKPS